METKQHYVFFGQNISKISFIKIRTFKMQYVCYNVCIIWKKNTNYPCKRPAINLNLCSKHIHPCVIKL